MHMKSKMSPGPGVKVQGITLQDDGDWLVSVEAKPVGICPDCGIRSRHRHGHRARSLADLPIQGRKVTVKMTLLRWQCRHQACKRRTIYFYTGARCTEPGRLKVKDLRFDREYMVLDFTIKGNKRNTIAIHPECVQAIRDFLDLAPHGHDPDAYMFQAVKKGKSEPGSHLSRYTLYATFKKYALLAGVPAGVFPHVARATFITEAYQNGVQGESIQRTVGHSSITTTEGYNHTAQKHRESASLKMGY